MNCKPGDLAVVVKSMAGHEGKILRVLKLVQTPKNYMQLPGGYWMVDRQLPGISGDMTPVFPDAWLRPIRDPGDDAVDETLLRLPAPKLDEVAA